MLKTVSVDQARRMLADGARLIDIREADEFAREHIPGATHAALSGLAGKLDAGDAPALIFHCKSGNRTAANAGRLAEAATCDAYLLEAWKQAGGDTDADRSQPIEIMRQVQITAGSLTLIGVILGFLVHPAWFGLSGFVGAGLTFAGVSGTCMMASLLGMMPWNRRQPIFPTPAQG